MIRALTLSQLATAVGNAVRRDPQVQSVWVTAELSDLRISGGHCYVELLEKDSRGQTVAKMRANIWQNYFIAIRRKFYQATGRDIASGLKVMLFGSVACHNLYGLSFTVSDIDPSYTLGDLERLRREIIERLTREGLASVNRNLPFPLAPQRIAVISAGGAAGYGDFINQLESSPEGFKFYTFLFPAVMQGERTAPSVAAALDLVEQTIDLWDCVAIVRGGGATTDLNGFDNYDLARRVCTFPLPVVVGIGHERDRNVLDELACVRCKTPTAVAAFFIDSLRDALGRANSLALGISNYVSQRLAGEGRRVANLQAMIPALSSRCIGSNRMRLDSIAGRIPLAASSRTSKGSLHLAHIADKIAIYSAARIADADGRLKMVSAAVADSSARVIERGNNALKSIESLVAALDPASTLRRGYSITRINGRAVVSADQIPPGSEIVTTLSSGIVTSIVSDNSGKKDR